MSFLIRATSLTSIFLEVRINYFYFLKMDFGYTTLISISIQINKTILLNSSHYKIWPQYANI